MLTASQCEVIAFACNGAILCKDCAKARYGEIRIVSAEEGFNVYGDVSPLIRFQVDEIALERAYDSGAFDEDEDADVPDIECESCGVDLR